MEPFVTCVDCSRKLHKVCVLYDKNIWKHGFTCDNCHKIRNNKHAENPYTAELLPATKLSLHIEACVNNFLQKEKANAGNIYITVSFSGDKTVEVQPGMKRRFVYAGEMCETFPYLAQSILAFEKIDKVDVCFIAMQVKEYGSDVPLPNAHRVYIAYLDSV
jgi:E1A/CREB-binding protein